MLILHRLFVHSFAIGLFIISLTFSYKVDAQENKVAIAAANEAYLKYEYANAAKLYEKAFEKNNKDGFLLSRLAACYKEMNNYGIAEKYYKQIIALPGTAPIEWLYYADMLKSTGKYVAAKQIYQQYQRRDTTNITNKLKGCDSAIYWMSHPNGYIVDNMAYLNTGKSDWGAVYNPTTNSVVFVSDSLRNTKKNLFKKTFNDAIYGRTDNNFQKIYAVSSEKNDPFNHQIHDFSTVLNNFQYHTGPIAFNDAYDSLYFTVTYNGTELSKGDNKHKAGEVYATRRLELYLSTLNREGQWNAPNAFTYNNPSAYSVGHAALSKDGLVLYFTSDMPGGYGGLDIWYCERLITGNWGLPKNCGSNLNTPEDEAFPNIGIDGNIYYASKGHIGMGGYDLFVSVGEKNNWSIPRNLGYPLNSSTDDFYYVFKDETSGFFASNRKGGLGDDDIYQFVIKDLPVIPNTRHSNILVLETTVIDNATKHPIDNASVAILNTSTDKLWETKSNLEGKNTKVVDNNTPYAITVNKQGYYPSIQAINTKNATEDTMKVLIPLDSKNEARPIARVYKLNDKSPTLHVGDKFRINNIHYNFDKDNIRPDAAKILDTLVDILHQYPSMVIELSSHTDSRGSDEYNEKLADRRAKSAVAYLISKGIARKRLIAKGYGEMLLLNECANDVPCSEAAHQENRRTEVKILKF